MADSQLWIQETVEIRARQIQGQVGQADASPLWKPTARLIYHDTATPMAIHGELIRLQDIADTALSIRPTAGGDEDFTEYLVIQVDKPVVVAFTQPAGGAAKSLLVAKFLLLDATDETCKLGNVTILATVDNTQIRIYWAAPPA